MIHLKKKVSDLIKKNKFEIAIFFYIFLFLAPILQCNFISDDGIYYFLRGRIIYFGNNTNIIEIVYNSILTWISRGRFFPLSAYAEIVMYFFNNNVLYKIVIIFAICINILMFGVFIEELTESRRIKLSLMLFMTLFFQIITVYHSPFLSFHIFMQVMFAILMFILIYLQRYLKNQQKRYLICSIIFFSIGLLTYELGFAFIGIVVLFIVYYKKSLLKSTKLCLIYCIPITIIGIINLIIKMNNVIGYEGVSIVFSPLRILKTLTKQCYAAFPLSNYIMSYNNGILKGNIIDVFNNISVQDILIAIIFMILLSYILKNTDKIKIKIVNIYFLFFSLAFYIFPGVLSSLTEKYQTELGFGIAHISVYIQYYGLILCILWLYLYLLKKCENINISNIIIKSFKNIVSFIIIVIILLNQQNARLYIENANLYWKYPKEAVQKAMQLNILDDITEYETLTVLTPYAWESSDFYSEFSKKKINYTEIETVVYNERTKLNMKGIDKIYPNNLYVIRYYGNEREQEAFLGKVESIIINLETEDIKSILVSNVKMFTNNIDNSHILYKIIDETENSKDNIIKLDELTYIQGDGKNDVYQLNTPNELVDFNSISFLQHYIAPQEKVNVQYKSGISILESYEGTQQWRWCEKYAEINIINNSEVEINVQISIGVSNLLENMSELNLNLNDVSTSFQYNNLGNYTILNVTLKPGDNILKMNTNAPRVDAPNDPRVMYFKLTNFTVEKIN